uniref:OVATE domain-containing protein n=2 Tax=Oryza brachyantha TaxID=4533 RepID=J3M612_ORYBR
MVARLRSRRSGGEEEEGACRSFESRLMEMLLEEGKVRDLQDVEELLRCWERLKSPVFVDLVCRFYGELCKDLFSPEEDAGGDHEGMHLAHTAAGGGGLSS